MPKCIKYYLLNLQPIIPNIPEHSPHKCKTPNDENTANWLGSTSTGKLLYYTIEINNTILINIKHIPINQTEDTRKTIHKLLS